VLTRAKKGNASSAERSARPPQGPQLVRRLVPDPPVQPQLMTGSLLGVDRGRNTSPVMPSITAARTDRGVHIQTNTRTLGKHRGRLQM